MGGSRATKITTDSDLKVLFVETTSKKSVPFILYYFAESEFWRFYLEIYCIVSHSINNVRYDECLTTVIGL